MIYFSQVWSLSRGTLLRNIVFPTVIDAIALDPAEHVFYAGGRDGKIYITALNTEKIFNDHCGMHIMGSFSNHRYLSSSTCTCHEIETYLLVVSFPLCLL